MAVSLLADAVCTLLSFGMLIYYHYKLGTNEGKPFLPKAPWLPGDKLASVGTRYAARTIKSAWVTEVQNKGMLGVNTLRDTQRAGFYNGNTAILLCTLVIGFAFSRFEECWPALHEIYEDGTDEFDREFEGCSSTKQYCLVKLMTIATNLYLIFHNFSQNVRFATNLQFALNVKQIDGWDVPAAVVSHYLSLQMPFTLLCLQPQAYMSRLTSHHHLGMRGWYMMGPFVAWLFGPVPLILVSVGTVFFLHHLDHFSGLTLPQDISVEAPTPPEEPSCPAGKTELARWAYEAEASEIGSLHLRPLPATCLPTLAGGSMLV
jgi:hypothetical protein